MLQMDMCVNNMDMKDLNMETKQDVIPSYVNQNSVIPETIIPVAVDNAAGLIIKETETVAPLEEKEIEVVQTSGTVTEEELVIDASKSSAEVLDEFSISMDAAAEKAKNKKDNIFIAIVFGIIIVFIIFLKVITLFIGY